jgi:hypothetical protein
MECFVARWNLLPSLADAARARLLFGLEQGDDGGITADRSLAGAFAPALNSV